MHKGDDNMIIWNQDRDNGIVYTEQNLWVMPIIHDGMTFGYNLHADDAFLGTFDDSREAFAESEAIKQARDNGKDFYFVSGYCSLSK